MTSLHVTVNIALHLNKMSQTYCICRCFTVIILTRNNVINFAKCSRLQHISSKHLIYSELQIVPLFSQQDIRNTEMRRFTYSILEVSVTYQFEVLFHSLSSERVLPKDQVLTVHESIHLTHRHVRQEFLRRDNICSSVEQTQRKDHFSIKLLQGNKLKNANNSELCENNMQSDNFWPLVFTFVFPVLWSMCTRANATSSLLFTLNSGSRTAHSVR